MTDARTGMDPGDWDELFSRDWLVFRGCKDDEGRPFAESKTPEEHRCGVTVEHVQCLYPGSRHKHALPMNLSAYRQMGVHWDEIMAGIELVRGELLRRRGITELRLQDLLRLCSFLVNIANYLLRRKVEPVPDGALPSFVGGLYKAFLGFSGVVFCVCLQRWAEGLDDETTVTAGELIDFAENHGLLIGPTEVCAGAPQAMQTVAEALILGSNDGHAGRSVLPEMIGDLDAYFAYADATVQLETLKSLFAVRHEVLAADLAAALRELRASGGERAPVIEALEERIAAWHESIAAWQLRERHSGAAINHFMAELPRESRDRVLAAMAELVRGLGGPSPDEEPRLLRVGREDDGVGELTAAELLQGLSATEAGAGFAPETLRLLASALVSYLFLERSFLRRASNLQQDIRRLLGHADARSAFAGADVERALGPTLRELIADVLGLAIDCGAGATTIGHGAGRLTLPGQEPGAFRDP